MRPPALWKPPEDTALLPLENREVDTQDHPHGSERPELVGRGQQWLGWGRLPDSRVETRRAHLSGEARGGESWKAAGENELWRRRLTQGQARAPAAGAASQAPLAAPAHPLAFPGEHTPWPTGRAVSGETGDADTTMATVCQGGRAVRPINLLTPRLGYQEGGGWALWGH